MFFKVAYVLSNVRSFFIYIFHNYDVIQIIMSSHKKLSHFESITVTAYRH